MQCSAPSSSRPHRAPTPLRRLLVVNDDMNMRPGLARQLVGALRCAVETAGSLEAALRAFDTHPPEAVLVDASTLSSCITLVRELRGAKAGRDAAIVVLLDRDHARDWATLRAAGADASFHEPIDVPELARAIRGIVQGRARNGADRA